MSSSAKLDTDETICQCFQVNESTIRAAIEKYNLREIEQITDKCQAGGGCHSCHILLQLFIDEHQKKNTPVEDLVQEHGQKVKKQGILSRFLAKTKSKPS